VREALTDKRTYTIYPLPQDNGGYKNINGRTAEVLYTPIFFLAEVYKSYQKFTLEIKKKSTYLVKVPFFPLIPFHIKKKTKITSPPKIFPVLIKFDTAHIFIPPAILREGVYSICPFVRECFPHCLCNSSLTT
jgi:hypothetical protein